MTAKLSTDTSRADCSVARALEVIGERWTVLVLREAFYGVRRFAEMHVAIGCAKSVLSARLEHLVRHGVLARVAYREEAKRERFEYALTAKGKALFPVVIALMQWGDRYTPAALGPPVSVRHKGCGASVTCEVRCKDGHGRLEARDTKPRLRAR